MTQSNRFFLPARYGISIYYKSEHILKSADTSATALPPGIPIETFHLIYRIQIFINCGLSACKKRLSFVKLVKSKFGHPLNLTMVSILNICVLHQAAKSNVLLEPISTSDQTSGMIVFWIIDTRFPHFADIIFVPKYAHALAQYRRAYRPQLHRLFTNSKFDDAGLPKMTLRFMSDGTNEGNRFEIGHRCHDMPYKFKYLVA